VATRATANRSMHGIEPCQRVTPLIFEPRELRSAVELFAGTEKLQLVVNRKMRVVLTGRRCRQWLA
jgi:hypothetical protein